MFCSLWWSFLCRPCVFLKVWSSENVSRLSHIYPNVLTFIVLKEDSAALKQWWNIGTLTWVKALKTSPTTIYYLLHNLMTCIAVVFEMTHSPTLSLLTFIPAVIFFKKKNIRVGVFSLYALCFSFLISFFLQGRRLVGGSFHQHRTERLHPQ